MNEAIPGADVDVTKPAAPGQPKDEAKPKRPRFEFTIAEMVNYKAFPEVANALGAEGWKLVGLDSIKLAHQVVVGYFQREVIEDQEAAPS